MPKILRDRMNNREFDEIIKKKLESLNTYGSEDAWDLFKEKWDSKSGLAAGGEELSSEDQDLDNKIKTDMQKLRIPFNSKHWIILKEQLELEALFKKKLFVAKSVELVILAFLVLGILNLWPIQNEIYRLQVYDIPMVQSIPVDKETAEKHEAQELALLSKQKIQEQQFINKAKTIVKKAITSVEKLTLSTSSPVKEKEKSIDNSIKSDKILEDNRMNKLDIQLPFIINSQNESSNKKSENNTVQDGAGNPIALLQLNEMKELELPIRPTGFPDIVLDSKKAVKDENTYISFAVGPKMNLVNSPFDPVYEIDPYNVINTNFNISVKVNKELGPIELYTGLGYTNTSYVPRLVDEIYEPLERQFSVASLENIKFKTFNVPIGVKYNVIESDKYELYASAGVDLNVIAYSDFDILDTPVGSGSNGENPNPSPTPPPPDSSPENEPVNSNAKLSQKEFNHGIFSGGSLKDNLYATASVGLGLNWKLSDRSGFFVEPKYSHFISSKGIGPNEDKVHGISVDLGFRYQIN